MRNLSQKKSINLKLNLGRYEMSCIHPIVFFLNVGAMGVLYVSNAGQVAYIQWIT